MNHPAFGAATIDITPPIGLQLCGYRLRPSSWIDHPLRAEALVCNDGTESWALITVDLLGISNILVQAVRRGIAAQTQLKPESILIAATHTHSGPRAVAAGWNEFPEEVEYFNSLRSALVAVAAKAWQTRRPGTLVHGRTEARSMASNRRIQKEGGEWTNEWHDPTGQHPGYVDPTIELLGVRREEGTLAALLVTYGCHPVTFGMGNEGISGDYPSYLKDGLEASGEIETALFAVSGHANVDPRICVQTDPEPVRQLGQELSAIVLAALPSLKPIPAAPCRAAREPWAMPVSWELSEHSRTNFPVHQAGETIHTEVQSLRAGAVALLGLPGETVSEYMERLRQTSPAPITLLLSVANDYVGYLVTEQILSEGAYEATMCPTRPIEAPLMAKATTVLERLFATECASSPSRQAPC